MATIEEILSLPRNWAEVEKSHRDRGETFMKQAEEYRQKASEIDASDPKNGRLRTTYEKLAMKYFVQGKNFFKLADDARKQRW